MTQSFRTIGFILGGTLLGILVCIHPAFAASAGGGEGSNIDALLAVATGPVVKFIAAAIIIGGVFAFIKGGELSNHGLQTLGTIAIALGALLAGLNMAKALAGGGGFGGISIGGGGSGGTFSYIMSGARTIAGSMLGNGIFVALIFALALTGTVLGIASDGLSANTFKDLGRLAVVFGVLAIALGTIAVGTGASI